MSGELMQYVLLCLKVTGFKDKRFCHLDKFGISEWHLDKLSEVVPIMDLADNLGDVFMG